MPMTIRSSLALAVIMCSTNKLFLSMSLLFFNSNSNLPIQFAGIPAVWFSFGIPFHCYLYGEEGLVRSPLLNRES